MTIIISEEAVEPSMSYDDEFKHSQNLIGALTSMIKQNVEANKTNKEEV